MAKKIAYPSLILEILVLIGLVALPLSEIFRIPLGHDIYGNPLDIVVGATAIVWVILMILGKTHKPPRRLFWVMFSFPLIGIVSLVINSFWLTSSQLETAFLYGVRVFAYTSIFFIVAGFGIQAKKRFFVGLFLMGLSVLLAGYVQYFLYSNLRNLYYLGWDEHMFRMFSIFLDPNFAGAFFVLFLFFLAGLYLCQKDRKKWFIGLVFVVTLIAIFLTYSRSALLMLVIGSTVLLFLIRQKKLLLFLFGIIVIALIILAPRFYIENTNLFRVNSSQARIGTTVNALKIIQDHPIFGVGFNAYRYAQIRYGFRQQDLPIPSHADAGVDNSWLFVLATTGIVGFFAYLLFWQSVLRLAYHEYVKRKNVFGAVIIASIVSLFVDALFINSLFYTPIFLWIFVLLGVTANEF